MRLDSEPYMLEDQTLVGRCQNNDRLAQRQLYEQYAGKMFAVCLRYTKNADDAQDVMQDGFIKVFDKINTFRFECPLESWVRTVMVNTALSFLRKSLKWRNSIDIEAVIENGAETEVILSGFEYETLLGFIRELPAGCQTVFNLCAIEGFQHREIARMLGISEGTSKSQYHRAKQLLQDKLLIERHR